MSADLSLALCTPRMRRGHQDATRIRGVHHRQTAPKPLNTPDAAIPAWALRARRG